MNSTWYIIEKHEGSEMAMELLGKDVHNLIFEFGARWNKKKITQKSGENCEFFYFFTWLLSKSLLATLLVLLSKHF